MGKIDDVQLRWACPLLLMFPETSEESKPPKHAHAFGNVGILHKQIAEERVTALKEFHNEVTAQNFPYLETNIGIHPGEKDKFLEQLDQWTPTHQ
jgi:3-methyl-2-oxobutanoate hydroxymethyltransferase